MKILVTRKIPESGVKLLQEKYEVELFPENRVMRKEEILERIRDKDILLCLLTDTIDAEILDAAPNLKIISNYAVGFNNIDVGAATERGIIVTNTPGVLTETTADLTWALLMATARLIPQSDKYTREGKWEGWDPLLFLGNDIYGKTLGVLGMGRIGSAVAKRAQGFDMKIVYYDDMGKKENAIGEYVDFDTLLRESDYISIHVPLNERTKHIIGEKQLAMMKPTACLINTARGPVVDEQALIKALQNNVIWGAGLDVFENEPEIPDELKKLNNAVILPHLGSATLETRSLMSSIAAENILLAAEGKMPKSLVNKDVLSKSKIKIGV